MPVFAAIAARLSPWALSSPGVLDLLRRMRGGAADTSASLFGDGTGVGSAFGGEGAFHLGEQHEQQHRDAAHALGGGVDPDRVGDRAHPDAGLGVPVGASACCP